MPRNSRKSSTEPNPLYAIAGAGDLAVEKIREISKIASDKLGSLESTDPAVVSDRVQERIEERADALAMALRTASVDLRIQAKDLTEKAQSAVQTVLIQAGDTYETLSERGKGAVIRIRSAQNGSSNGRQISRSGSSRSSASRSKSTTTRKRSTAKRSAKPRTAASSTAKSTAAKSTAKSGTPRKNSSAPARKTTS
jgi:hypothetical protein